MENNNIYMLRLSLDRETVIVDTFIKPKYRYESKFKKFLKDKGNLMKAKNFRQEGFSEIVDAIPTFRGCYPGGNYPRIDDEQNLSSQEVFARIEAIRVNDAISKKEYKYMSLYTNKVSAYSEKERLDAQLKAYYQLLNKVREHFEENNLVEVIRDDTFIN